MQYYMINERPYSFKQNLEEELKIDRKKTTFFDLDYLGLITLSGEKSLDFLQGQVTCDMRKLTEKKALSGAICNIKGRILTLFHVMQHQGLKMVVPLDVRQQTIDSLNKTAVLSRVSVEVDSTYSLFGIYAEEKPVLDYPIYELGDSFYLTILPEKDKEKITNSKGSLAWHTVRLKHHYIEIYPQTRGEFLPHRLNLHTMDYIHFDKGCYKGQEIIARMHYKSTLKHELSIFSSLRAIKPLVKIMDESSKIEIGEVVDYTPISDKQFLIAASVLIDRPEFGVVDGMKLKLF